MSTLERAIAIAAEAHAGQTDKSGTPYILHPLRLMLTLQTEAERIVAVLHDVIEDTPITFGDLRAEGFTEQILAALDSVTKRDGEDYEAFVLRAAGNPVGRKVKLADLHDNSDISRLSSPTEKDYARLEKYKRAIAKLEASMGHQIQERTQDLQFQESQLARIEQIAQAGTWELNVATNQVTWSKGMFRIFGLDPAQGAPPFSEHDRLFSAEDFSRLQTAINQAINDGTPYEMELDAICADGKRRHGLVRGRTKMGQDGAAVTLYGSFQDITDIRQTEQALAESHRRLQALFDHSQDAILLANDQGEYVDANPAASELTGYSREELLKLAVWNLTPDMNRIQGKAMWQQFLASGESREDFTIQHKDGRLMETEFRAVANILPSLHLSIIRDVTSQRQQQLELENTKTLLEKTFNSLQEAVLVIDPLERTIVTCNPAVEKVFGYKPDELIGQKTEILYQSLADFRHFGELSEPVLAQKSVFHTEFEMKHKTGAAIITENTVTVLKEMGQWREGVVSVVRDVTERKQAEETLHAREAELREAQRIGKMGSWQLDIDQNRLTWSEQIYEMFGINKESFAGTFDAFLAYVHPEDRDRLMQAKITAERGDAPLNIEHRIIRSDGEIRYVHERAEVVMNGDNGSVKLIGTVQDITARSRAEAQLIEHTQQLETLHEIDRAILAQNSPAEIAGVVVHHLSRLIDCQRISASWISETGDTVTVLAAYVKDGATSILPGQTVSLKENQAALAKLRRGETHIFSDLTQLTESSSTIRQLVQEGLRSYMTVPLRASGHLIGTLSLGAKEKNVFGRSHELFVKEVADQLAIALQQADLMEAEKAQRLLAETLQQTAVTLGGSLSLPKTLDAILNQLALVVDYDLAQVLLIEGELLTVDTCQGTLAEDLEMELARPYLEIRPLRHALQSGEPIMLSQADITKNHLDLPGLLPTLITWVGVPLIARDVAVGFLTVGSAQDTYHQRQQRAIIAFAQQAALAIEKAAILTDLQQSLRTLQEAQARLLRTARLSAIGETAAGVAHQINNPLTTVVIDSHLLMKNLPADHPARKSAVAIHQAARRTAGIVERLLDFSQTKPTRKTAVDVGDSVQEAVTLVSAQLPPNIKVHLHVAEGLPLVQASYDHLQDVWFNLLLNARDAILPTDGGQITINITHNDAMQQIEVAVTDDGVGITAAEKSKLFTPFYTTKAQGTGLGLTVCYDIINHHGGAIQIHSVPGKGSTFTVVLPLSTPSDDSS